MFAIAYPDGTPVCSRTVYMTERAAEVSAARMFSDPLRAAPALPHIPGRTWREVGYRVVPVVGIQDQETRTERRGHACPGAERFGGALCHTPERPLGRPVYGSDRWGMI
ncbi:MAG: hypothetical protein NTY77_05455 [Elusimicrobia bacterium]|nr:hypothetical protein [Elusimicrobiota bacterium]